MPPNFLVSGHRELSDSVADITRTASEYQFDDEMESALSVFATLTKRDAKVRRALNTLTYEDVYWASKIENPMVPKLLTYGDNIYNSLCSFCSYQRRN